MGVEKQARILGGVLLRSLVAVGEEFSALTAPCKHANSASMARDF